MLKHFTCNSCLCVYKMLTRIIWLVKYVYDNKQKSCCVAYGAKKLMDNDIFLVMVKNTDLLWLLQYVSVFWC